MQVSLAYGQTPLVLDFREEAVVIQPEETPGLPDEPAAVREALDHPIGSVPLRSLAKPGSRVCVTFTDLTRATPNDRLIPWLLQYLADLPSENVVLLNQNGTHRANTPAELEAMLGPEILRKYRVLNHEASDESMLVQVGTMRDGTPALLNRHVVEADVRVVTGFIEPHFFAGFSGGPKGIIPGCGGLRSISANHSARHIGDPNAAFGITVGNPLWEELRDVALRVAPTFLLNVTLNTHRAITGVFAGDLVAAHAVGTDFVRKSAMRPVEELFDVVVTTNSGYPLDLNLYQGVKGMAAAARIVRPGGTILLACECRDGVPGGSHYERLLRAARSPAHLLEQLQHPGFHRPEQWQAQIQALIQKRARVLVHSRLPEPVLRACHLEPCEDLEQEAEQALQRYGSGARLAILPQGPLTIPYFSGTGLVRSTLASSP